ncbi:MAG: potassium channel family protein, partial [Actinomycetales bacterium]
MPISGVTVVVGDSDVGRRVCSELARQGRRTVHLGEPSDAELDRVLSGDIDAVAVMMHDDIRALRYCLVIEHLRPEVRLSVAIFDKTVRRQLQATIPNCVVLSPAAISVPAITAAAVDPQAVLIMRQPRGTWQSLTDAGFVRWVLPIRLRLRSWLGVLAGQLRPHDAGSTTLVAGALGLILVTGIDAIIGLQHATAMRALYDAVRTTATISAPDLPDSGLLLGWASIAALLVLGFTATFGAGLVNYLLSGRHVTLIGRRVLPRSGHVIVVGMGQVGLRVAEQLRAMGIAVAGVERYDTAPTVPLARALGVPVIFGDGSSRRVLLRAGVRRALAVVAVGSDERDNIAVAVTALACQQNVRVILRAGSDDAIMETTSLFHIGSVIDVNGLTAAFVAQALHEQLPVAAGLTP